MQRRWRIAAGDDGRVIDPGVVHRQRLGIGACAVTGRHQEGLAGVGAQCVDLAGIGHKHIGAAAAVDIQRAVGSHLGDVVADAVDGAAGTACSGGDAIAQCAVFCITGLQDCAVVAAGRNQPGLRVGSGCIKHADGSRRQQDRRVVGGVELDGNGRLPDSRRCGGVGGAHNKHQLRVAGQLVDGIVALLEQVFALVGPAGNQIQRAKARALAQVVSHASDRVAASRAGAAQTQREAGIGVDKGQRAIGLAEGVGCAGVAVADACGAGAGHVVDAGHCHCLRYRTDHHAVAGSEGKAVAAAATLERLNSRAVGHVDIGATAARQIQRAKGSDFGKVVRDAFNRHRGTGAVSDAKQHGAVLCIAGAELAALVLEVVVGSCVGVAQSVQAGQPWAVVDAAQLDVELAGAAQSSVAAAQCEGFPGICRQRIDPGRVGHVLVLALVRTGGDQIQRAIVAHQ